MSKLIPFPDREGLKKKLEDLREELSRRILERDELRFVIGPNLEEKYQLTFGSLEYRVYDCYCEYCRLKRKAALIREKQNRQEAVDPGEIEKYLDNEFRDYQKNLKQKLDQIKAALERSQARTLTAEENKEIKSKYRAIVLALHPDLHPHLSEQEKSFLQSAMEAYESGDLNTIRLIAELFASSSKTELPDTVADLSQESSRLENMIAVVQDMIAKMWTIYPYDQKELLENSEKIAQKKAELQATLENYEAAIRSYEGIISDLLKGSAR